MGRSSRFAFLLALLILADQVRSGSVFADGPPGSHYRLDGNKNGTSYSATITENGRGVWISVHAGRSYSGSYSVPGNGSTISYASSTASGVNYSQPGSRSSSTSNIVRTWNNVAGEPYYETTSGQVYHLAGVNIGVASAGPTGWFTVGMQQHPGTVPEALYVNGKLQGIVWVPVGKGGLHWGTPPGGNANATANAPIVVDPRAVAIDILRHVPLPNVQIRMNPSRGLVALPGWFWAEGYDGAAFGGSASVAGITVAVQVQPVSYTWTFGDGTSLVSHDLGQPYPAQSDIQHTYQYSSLHFPRGFPIHLTIQFAATYSVNGGPAQPLGPLTGNYAASYQVQELQSVLTNR